MAKKLRVSPTERLILTEADAISLEKVLQYLWEDEQENHNSMVEEGGMSEPVNGEPTDEEHIFYHLYKLNQKLQEYKNRKIDKICDRKW
ncbi:MAG: hypothetical protein WC333_02080 [Dehalococcoidia bacterium]|jgi:hypothetical protein